MKPYTVQPANRNEADELVRAHYLHSWPGVVTCSVGLWDGWTAIGVIVFALPPIQTSIRYGGVTVWELARLFVIDGTPKNTESWFMSRAIRYVKKNHPDVAALISYSDPAAGHCGTIYQAGNWISDGFTEAGRKTPRSDYYVDGKKYSRMAHIPEGWAYQRVARIPKARWVYWMEDHEKKRKESRSGVDKTLKRC